MIYLYPDDSKPLSCTSGAGFPKILTNSYLYEMRFIIDVARFAGLFEMNCQNCWPREVLIIQSTVVMTGCGGACSAHTLWPLWFFVRQMLKIFKDKWLFYCLLSNKVVFIELALFNFESSNNLFREKTFEFIYMTYAWHWFLTLIDIQLFYWNLYFYEKAETLNRKSLICAASVGSTVALMNCAQFGGHVCKLALGWK